MKLIRTEKEYDQALERLGQIFEAKDGSPEYDEAVILSLLIEKYEDTYHPIPEPADPIHLIRTRMEELGLKQKDLIEAIGSKSHVSEVLNFKRPLSLNMMRNLHDQFDLPVEILIKEYPLNREILKKLG